MESTNQSLIFSDGRWNHSLLQSYEDDIRDFFNDIKFNFIEIGQRLSIIESVGAYRTAVCYPECWGGTCSRACNNIYEYAEVKFGYGRTTTKNFLALYKEFCSPSGSLLPEYKDFNYSQLVEMIPLASDQREQITPKATIKDIRKVKKSLKQLEIEDVSEDVPEEDSEEVSGGIGQTSDQKEEVIPENKSDSSCLLNNFVNHLWLRILEMRDEIFDNKFVQSGFVEAIHRVCNLISTYSICQDSPLFNAEGVIDKISFNVQNPYKEKSVQYNIYQKAVDDVISLFKDSEDNDND